MKSLSPILNSARFTGAISYHFLQLFGEGVAFVLRIFLAAAEDADLLRLQAVDDVIGIKFAVARHFGGAAAEQFLANGQVTPGAEAKETNMITPFSLT